MKRRPFAEAENGAIGLETLLPAALHDDFSRSRDAWQPQTARNLPLVHNAGFGQFRLFGIVDHQRIEILGIGKRPAHDTRAGDTCRAVGESDRAGILQKADFRHLLALETTRRRGHRVDIDNGRIAGAPFDEVDQGDII